MGVRNFQIFTTVMFLSFRQTGLGKQCRPRSDCSCSDFFSSLVVLGKCRASDIMQYIPMEFTIIRSRAMTLSRCPQCRALSRAVMDEKSLSPLFPIGGEGGGKEAGAVVINVWCIISIENLNIAGLTYRVWTGRTLFPQTCTCMSTLNNLKIIMIHIWESDEPPHDKTNKMTVRPAKTQISLDICRVWS